MRISSAQRRLEYERRAVPQRLGSLYTNSDARALPVVRTLYDDAHWTSLTTRCTRCVVVAARGPDGRLEETTLTPQQMVESRAAMFDVGRVVDATVPCTRSPVGQYILRLTGVVVDCVDALYVLGRVRENSTLVEGTLKWPVEHVLRHLIKPVFLFNLDTNRWMHRQPNAWVEISDAPSLRNFRVVACLGATADKTTPEARAAMERLTADLR